MKRHARSWIYRLAILIIYGAMSSVAFNATGCEAVYAPAKFSFKSDPGSPAGHPVNVGIVTQGFVALRDTPSVQGIDVSKWQDSTDFTALRGCLDALKPASAGGPMHAPFVYVRLTAGEDLDNETLFRAHWYNARSENLFVGPYHSFMVKDAGTAAATLTPAQMSALERDNLDSAAKQAQGFVDRFGKLLLADPLIDVAAGDHGKPYMPIALTLIEKPQQRFGDNDRRAIGRLYGAAACKWIQTVKASPSFSGQRVIVFTSEEVYETYDLASAPCDLRAGGIWISQHTLDGTRNGDDPKSAASLCLDKQGRNLCIIQQYTSYGGFALFDKAAPLDLDRFYGSEADLTALLQHARHPELWK